MKTKKFVTKTSGASGTSSIQKTANKIKKPSTDTRGPQSIAHQSGSSSKTMHKKLASSSSTNPAASASMTEGANQSFGNAASGNSSGHKLINKQRSNVSKTSGGAQAPTEQKK